MQSKTITQRILTAEEGMYLYNGESFGKTVVLPMEADHSVWKEITAQEKEALEQEETENA